MNISKILLEYEPKDISKLTDKELRSLVSSMASVANKRVKRAYSGGRTSSKYNAYIYGADSYEAWREEKGFSVKGKNINQLRAEFTRAYNFLQDEKTTAKGYQKAVTKFEEQFRELTGMSVDEFTDEEIREYFSQIHKFRENYPDKNLQYDAKTLARQIKKGASESTIQDTLRESMQYNYEAAEEERRLAEDAAMRAIQNGYEDFSS